MMLSWSVSVRYSAIRRPTFDMGIQSKVAGSFIFWTRVATRSTPPRFWAWAGRASGPGAPTTAPAAAADMPSRVARADELPPGDLALAELAPSAPGCTRASRVLLFEWMPVARTLPRRPSARARARGRRRRVWGRGPQARASAAGPRRAAAGPTSRKKFARISPSVRMKLAVPLGVKLDAVERAALVPHRLDRAGVGAREPHEARRAAALSSQKCRCSTTTRLAAAPAKSGSSRGDRGRGTAPTPSHARAPSSGCGSGSPGASGPIGAGVSPKASADQLVAAA